MRTIYEWLAIMEDSSQFRQYTQTGENLYKDIDFKKINSFILTNGSEVFGVNFKHKCFVIGDKLIYVGGDSKFKYFRRNEVDIGSKPAHRIWQVIQYCNFELEINEQTNQVKLKWVPQQ